MFLLIFFNLKPLPKKYILEKKKLSHVNKKLFKNFLLCIFLLNLLFFIFIIFKNLLKYIV